MRIERFVRMTGFFFVAISALCLGPSRQSTAQNKAPEVPSPQKLRLEPCRLAGWNEDVRCGNYAVFEDRRAKAGRRITLKVVVLPALAEKPAPDPVFYFSGGPGGSAVDTVTRAGKPYLAGLRRDRDIVFVDQRGTGASNPLPCNLYGDRNDITNFVGELFSLEKLRACRAELEKSADLKLYSTPMAMEDLDEIRAALGYDRVNLYGGSYGSTAALVYLRQFSQHVRTATLLGVVAPEQSLPLPFAKGVQNSLDRLFQDCAADDKCRAAFPDLKSDLNTALKLLDKEPASVDALNPYTRKPQHVTLTRAAFVEFVRTLLYTQDGSRWLPLMTHQAADGEFGLFVTIGFQLFRSIDDQIARGMHFSVVCGEDIPFVTDEDAKREMIGSFYGEGRLKAYRQACEIWPGGNVPASFTSPVKSDVPVLLISGEADPVAPPWLAEAAARQLTNGRHVIVPHTGHSFGYPCVDALVVAFVTKGSARELDVACLSQVKRPPFVTEEMLAAIARSQVTREDSPSGAELEVWQGVLEIGQAKLRLVLRLSRRPDGKLTAKVDSPDQNASGMPVSAINFTDKSLRFEMDIIGAVYEGKLNGSEITGHWQQGGNSWPLDFKRSK